MDKYGRSASGASPAFLENETAGPAPAASLTILSCASARTLDCASVPKVVRVVVESEALTFVESFVISISGGVRFMSIATTTKTSLSNGFNCRSILF